MELLHVCCNSFLLFLTSLLLCQARKDHPLTFPSLSQTSEDIQEPVSRQNRNEENEKTALPPGEWGPKTSHFGDKIQQRQRKSDELLEQLHDYEIVVPSRVDHEGNFISHDVTDKTTSSRKKRSTENIRQSRTDSPHNIPSANVSIDYSNSEDEWIYYKLRAFGVDYIFNLTRNSRLVAPKLVVEFWNESGVDWRHNWKSNCHFVGHASRDERKINVALSNCHGLHGMFGTGEEDIFVEPLWNISHTPGQHHHHVIYKRSSINKNNPGEHSCGVDDVPLLRHRKHLETPWSFSQLLKPHHHGYHHKEKYRGTKRRRQRRSVSSEKFVETVVVADRMMVVYHGTSDIERYILTVMNIPNLSVGHRADSSLESFCRWQQSVNTPENNVLENNIGISHHDNAILLTRYDICAFKNQPCGTLGLAPVGGMCDPERSCSLAEDIGLASAFTIAHEIGHNFGMQHDGSLNQCGRPGQEPAKIMAAQLSRSSDPFSWSSCSREYITSFLDSGNGRCLDNAPEEPALSYPSALPGQMHSANQQCRLQYGQRSSVCKYRQMCRKLWCKNGRGKCVTNSIPAAEGTPCLVSRYVKGWCYHGECVRQNYNPVTRDGSWSRWSPWGDCSVTCGAGIMSSQRYCNNPEPLNGGKYCVGERKRYRTCNIQECPLDATDFRELQCGNYNMNMYRGKYFKWKAYSGSGAKPCALNCMAVGYNFYTEKAPKVTDGTRCYPDSYDMCIDGECKRVGCDYVIGSDTVEDKCRVCGGNGSTCEEMADVITEPLVDFVDEYKDMVRLPRGAVHVKIEETTSSKNYIALKTKEGRYYINGDWTIDWPRKFTIANTVFTYERPLDGPERIFALGPLSEDLIVVLLLQEVNSGLSYQYNMPLTNLTHNTSDYEWRHTPWSECTMPCSGGTSSSLAVCVRKEDSVTVEDDLCVLYLKPRDKQEKCNEQICPPTWRTFDWSDCSVTCGGGVKTRMVKCLQTLSATEVVLRSYNDCLTEQPPSNMACNEQRCPAQWAAGEWTRCHAPCGTSFRTRRIYCVSPRGTYLPTSECDYNTRPVHKLTCSRGPCPPPRWRTSAWSQCSSSCGPGRQNRSVACISYTRNKSTGCDEQIRPSSVRVCHGGCVTQAGYECEDKEWVTYCPLVLRSNFCSRAYFRKMCCRTCSQHHNMKY